eukprot:TRINITY_DN15767_c0_g1_i1.p1 TRINITY_DN15767_c0_g1~~TRINITY_DN15767_c0_g1_i1.p1  ORF type:complete len:308 (+),score=44.26 TRINITY_DN15767_c0_g1_i1:68-991(+)
MSLCSSCLWRLFGRAGVAVLGDSGGSNVDSVRDSRQARVDGPKVNSVPMHVTVCTMMGTSFDVEVRSNDSVWQLKERLAETSGMPAENQQLLVGQDILTDDTQCLHDVGVTETSEVMVLMQGPLPSWARNIGLDRQHPVHFREYLAARSFPVPDSLDSDEKIWEVLNDRMIKFENDRAQLRGWACSITLTCDERQAATLYVTPGQKVSCCLRGWVYNNAGDTCIQQVILVQGRKIVAEVYNGVPTRGQNLNRTVTWTAPSEQGVHMLWKSNHLQYSMENAKRELSAKLSLNEDKRYPSSFVGWVVVQ